MREIRAHKSDGLNAALNIEVLDEPGPGNACHKYRITPTTGNAIGIVIDFQKGPLKETVHPNGVSNEVLLAIVADRLSSFQSGKFSCRENALALTKIQEALHWLHHRTNDRIARDVEGTNEK